MSRFETWLKTDLKKPNVVVPLHGRLFTQDNMSNLVGVHVYDNGQPAESLGGAVTGWVMRSDGQTVVITGTVEGNDAYVILPESAYAVPGEITITLRHIVGTGANEVKTTLAVCTGYVYRTVTGAIIDPGSVVPDLASLLAKIEEMEEATADANAAATAANTAASNVAGAIATPYASLTFPVSKGTYCSYNGSMYVANTDIATSEAWTAAHWTNTNSGKEISENVGALKSAINVLDHRVDDAESSITPLETDTTTLATRTFTGGGYRKTSASGNFSYQSSTIEYTSQLIPLNGATSIKVRQKRPEGNSDGTGWSVVNFFDANEEIILNKISTNTSDDTDYTDNEYEVPSGAVYVSYLTHVNYRAEARLELNSGKTSLVDRIENIESVLMNEVPVDTGTPTAGVFYRDGEILSSSSYNITDFIPCEEGDTFGVKSYGVGDSWQWQVAFYDASKNVLTFGYKGTGTSVEKSYDIVVPYTNCKYIRVSYTVLNGHGATITKKLMANPGAFPELQETVEQAQTDIETLKDVTVMPIEVPILATRLFTNGGYKRTTSGGSFALDTSSTSYYTSQLIALNGAVTVKIRQLRPGGSATNPNATGWSVVNFFDENQNAISHQISNSTAGDSDYTNNEYAVPSGAVYVSYLTGVNYRAEAHLIAIYENVSAADRIEEIEQNTIKEIPISIGEVSSGVFYRDGEILSSVAYEITDYLPCKYGDNFVVSSNGVADSWQWQVAYYDTNKNLLTFGYKGTGTSVFKTITVNIPYYNCSFIRVSYYKDGGISITKKTSAITETPLVITLNKQALDDALASGANKGRFTGNNNPDSFVLLHFSDIHGTVQNLKDISSVQKYLASCLDDTLCTGDIMASNWSNDYAFWDQASDGSILTCIGNHDVKASNAGGEGYLTNQQSEEDLYGRYMENYISGWSVEHSGTNLYYYKDYAAKKIRLIVLNLLYPTSEKTAEQNNWLANALAGAKTAGYGVIIGEHYYPVSGTRIECTFSALVNFPTEMANPGNYMYNGDALTTYQATVQNFIDGGGNFVCWLCGHKHADYIVYHPTYPKQVFIGVGGALFTPRDMETSHTSDMRRISDTRSQNCMNVLAVDPVEKKIRVIRIGSDRDFLGRHRGTLVLDYSTSPATVEYNN